MKFRYLVSATAAAAIVLTASAPPALAQVPDEPVTIAAARLATAGEWQGKLEYLDYQANQWFGIPVRTVIEDQGDGVTLIYKSDFDDGPNVGNVRITSIDMIDPASGEIVSALFRKGRDTSLSRSAPRFEGTPVDLDHWVTVTETAGEDDTRPAMIRITVTRDGDRLETLKQVDFTDDDKAEWISRNRTQLTRAAPAP